jgi:K+-transporting ATPase A subunit
MARREAHPPRIVQGHLDEALLGEPRLLSAASVPWDTPTFGVLVLGTVVLLGELCFPPALVLRPFAEHLHP